MALATSTKQQEKQFVAATSVAAAVFLTAMKLIVGIATGSLGLLAEAAHSGLDLIAALFTFFAVRISDRAPDARHHYGHGKVENLSALAQTLLLFLTCGWIIYEALERLLVHPSPVDANVWAFATILISIAVDVSRSRALERVARKYQSQALEADALHFRTDIWSSLVVLAGLILVRLGIGGGHADAVAALIVAVMVIYVSWQLARKTINALLDTAPDGLTEKVTAAAAGLPGVSRVIRARIRGHGQHIFADLHVAVPRHYSLQESHDVAHRVEEAVRAITPGADVLVDTEPSAENENILQRIQAVTVRGRFDVHHVSVHETPRGLYIDLDLEVDPTLSFERAHAQATELERQLEHEFGSLADINVHIEPRDKETQPAVEMPVEQARPYAERLDALRREFPLVREIQDVRLQRMPKGVHLSFHALMDATCSVTEVHQLAQEMETRLRREFPELARILIHTEPFLPH